MLDAHLPVYHVVGTAYQDSRICSSTDRGSHNLGTFQARPLHEAAKKNPAVLSSTYVLEYLYKYTTRTRPRRRKVRISSQSAGQNLVQSTSGTNTPRALSACPGFYRLHTSRVSKYLYTMARQQTACTASADSIQHPPLQDLNVYCAVVTSNSTSTGLSTRGRQTMYIPWLWKWSTALPACA